ncbi:hypothetical protein BVX97_03145 [bacterium E08(2017)]|nr:hypothetical protein BVX97_03145 [bacterium E08(2017)]
MMSHSRNMLFVSILFVTVAVTAFAQSADRGDPVRFSIAAEVEGTDNRDSAPKGFEESNFDVYIKPKIDIVSDTERTIFDFYYVPTYRYRTDPSAIQNEDEFQHQLGLQVKHQLGAATIFRLDEWYVYTDDPGVEVGGTTTRRDSSFAMNDFEVGMGFDLSEKVMFDISGDYMFKTYDDELVARESDEDSSTLNAKLTRMLQPTLHIYASAVYAQYGYDTAGNSERGFEAMGVGFGMDRILSDTVRAGIHVGAKTISYEDATVEDTDSPNITAKIQIEPSAQTRLLISLMYGLLNSDVYPYSSQDTTSIYTKLDYNGIERITLSIWGQYRDNKYDRADVAASVLAAEGFGSIESYMASLGFASEGNETTMSVGAELKYSIAERTSMRLVQSFEDVDSDVSTVFSRSATRVGLSRSF